MGAMKEIWQDKFDSIVKEIVSRTGYDPEMVEEGMHYYMQETRSLDLDRAAMFAVSYPTEIIDDEDCLREAISEPAYYFDSNEDKIVSAWSVMLDFYQWQKEGVYDYFDDEIECFQDFLEAATDMGGFLRPLNLYNPGEVEKFYLEICSDLPFDDALDVIFLYGPAALEESAAG